MNHATARSFRHSCWIDWGEIHCEALAGPPPTLVSAYEYGFLIQRRQSSVLDFSKHDTADITDEASAFFVP